MNKTPAIVLLIILVAVGGFILYGKENKTKYNTNITVDGTQNGTPDAATTPLPDTTPTTVTVVYTDSGFSPAVISIPMGSTVTFINQSSGKMWIASDPHPQHTVLSAFDEKVAVENGGTYSYTFATTGQFGFHNHMSANKIGVITVK